MESMLQLHFKMAIKFLVIIIFLFLLSNSLLAEEQDSSVTFKKSTVMLRLKHFDNYDSWFGRDKGLHLAGSLIGTILLTNLNKKSFGMNNSGSKRLGAGVVFSLGIIKETFDGHQVNNKFSWKDLLANVTGILLGLAILEID